MIVSADGTIIMLENRMILRDNSKLIASKFVTWTSKHGRLPGNFWIVKATKAPSLMWKIVCISNPSKAQRISI